MPKSFEQICHMHRLCVFAEQSGDIEKTRERKRLVSDFTESWVHLVEVLDDVWHVATGTGVREPREELLPGIGKRFNMRAPTVKKLWDILHALQETPLRLPRSYPKHTTEDEQILLYVFFLRRHLGAGSFRDTDLLVENSVNAILRVVSVLESESSINDDYHSME